MSGISSVVHDQVLSLTELGYHVLLLYAARWVDATATSTQVCLCYAAAYQSFRWQNFCATSISFESFDDLKNKIELDEYRPLRSAFAQVEIVHSHADWIIPRASNAGNFNSYQTLLDCVERLRGSRPKLVRTRHDDLQGSLDRFMRLTGIDFVKLNDDDRLSILDGSFDLQESVARRTESGRAELLAQGFTQGYLDEAIHHVWFVTAQWQLWRREQMDADAIVSLNRRAMDEIRCLMPPCRDNLDYVYNGTSFGRHNQERIDSLLSAYHGQRGLRCFRGDELEKEPIAFSPEDQKVLFVGRDDPSKGIVEFVRGVALLRRRGYSKVRAIIAGRFDQLRRSELCAYDLENASQYLLFTGHIDDADELAALLAFGNVTAICSHYDPFNLVACESYRLGTPCVITEGIGAADVYIEHPARLGKRIAMPIKKPALDGLNRFFGVDIDSLAEQIANFIDNPELAFKLGRDGREFVEEHYNYLAMGKRYAELYQRLVLCPH